jgi:hypothetical protein
MLSGSQILLAIAVIASVVVAHPPWNPYQPNLYQLGRRPPLPFPHRHGRLDNPIIIIEIVTGNGTFITATTASPSAATSNATSSPASSAG